MIQVDPMPDELAMAHERRIGRVNCCLRADDLKSLICGTLKSLGQDPSGMPRLKTLALLSGLSVERYVQQHSMIPVLRLTSVKENVGGQSYSEDESFMRLFGMRSHRKGGFCCLQCVSEDIHIQHLGYSWFRRAHHLVGVDWCQVHDCALSFVDAPDPFSLSPQTWANEGKLITVKTGESHLPKDGFLRRFVDIAVSFLCLTAPIAREVVSSCVVSRARQLGFQTSRNGKRVKISDCLFELAPRSWLELHLNDVNKKAPNKYFEPVDCVTTRSYASNRTVSYFLALAALYSSAKEAFDDLRKHSSLKEAPPAHRDRVIYPSTMWHPAMWSSYLASGGSIDRLSKALNVSRKTVSEKVAKMGLPLARDINNKALWQAFTLFSKGQSLAEACQSAKVTPDELESFLREKSQHAYTAGLQIQTTYQPHARRKAGP